MNISIAAPNIATVDDPPKIEIIFIHAFVGLAHRGERIAHKPTNLGSLGFIDRHGFIATNDYELAQHNRRVPSPQGDQAQAKRALGEPLRYIDNVPEFF